MKYGDFNDFLIGASCCELMLRLSRNSSVLGYERRENIGITLFGAFITASKRRVVVLSKVGLSHLKD